MYDETCTYFKNKQSSEEGGIWMVARFPITSGANGVVLVALKPTLNGEKLLVPKPVVLMHLLGSVLAA